MVECSKPRSIYTMLHESISYISCTCKNEMNEGEHRKYEDVSEKWDTDIPPMVSLSWRRSFSQLRKQWSDKARNIVDGGACTSGNMDAKNASFRSDNEEFTDNENPAAFQYSNSDDSIDDNDTLCCHYEESLTHRSEDLQALTEEVLKEISPQVESILRRSSMSNREKRLVVDNFLSKVHLDPIKRDCVARSMIRRSTTTFEEMRDTLIYSIKRDYAKLEQNRNSVRALVQALILNGSEQRKTLRFIFSKEPAHTSFGESDSFQKVEDEVWVLAKGGDINNDITRAKIESILRTSTLNEDEKEFIIDRVLRENVLDANVRNIFENSMRIRSTMSTDERNHNIINLLECINLPSGQMSDITSVLLEDYPSGYHSRSELNQFNVESAINALIFHIASAHNFKEHQARNDFHSQQTKIVSIMESKDCVESHSESELKPSSFSQGRNYLEPKNPNNTQEIEIEQNPISNPTCYQVHKITNTRNATKTSRCLDLKVNLFPDNCIGDYSDERKVSKKYKKSRYCDNTKCAVKLRKKQRKPESILKEFFQEIPYDCITSDEGYIPGDTCSCEYKYNGNQSLYSATHIDGRQLQNVGSGAHLQMEQKKSVQSQRIMKPYNGNLCICNPCRKLKSENKIEHETIDGQQLPSAGSGAPLKLEQQNSVPSQIIMSNCRCNPCTCNPCRKLKSETFVEHEIFDDEQLEKVGSAAPLPLEQKKSGQSQIITKASDKNCKYLVDAFNGDMSFQQDTRSQLGNNSATHIPRSKVSISDRSSSSSKNILKEMTSNADRERSNNTFQTESSRSAVTCSDKHGDASNNNSFHQETRSKLGNNSAVHSSRSDSQRSSSKNSVTTSANAGYEHDNNNTLQTEPSKITLDNVYNDDKHDKENTLENKRPRTTISGVRDAGKHLGYCNCTHEFSSYDPSSSHKDFTSCVCVSMMEYLSKKCRELFPMKMVRRSVQLISYFGRFMWLPILIALIWTYFYKKDDSVRCFIYCRQC